MLGLGLDLFRHNYPSNSQEAALSEWTQHVADVWLCSAVPECAVGDMLGEDLVKNDGVAEL